MMLALILACAPREDSLAAAAVEAGAELDCAIYEDSSLDCWGVRGTSDWLPPAEAPMRDAEAVVAGWGEACALWRDHSLTCWSEDQEVDLMPPEGAFSAVSFVQGGLCALEESTGAASCWPDDAARLPLDVDYAALDGNGNATCALTAEGTVECFDAWPPYDPLPAPEGTFRSITAAACAFCALDGDGYPTCWGEVATDPPSDTRFLKVSGDASFFCGLTAEHTVTCWGDNGDTSTTSHWGSIDECRNIFEPAPPNSGYITDVSLGTYHGVVVQDGQVVKFGHYDI